jgi:uncharacterized protein (DUF2336 family)
LSNRLGQVSNAPIEVVRRLARDDDVTVAEPVLRGSERLTDHDLVDVATTKSQGHLLAIAGRTQVTAVVTDVLLQRGDKEVFHKLAENKGANFSDTGYATLVQRSENDASLAEKVGLRLDIPVRLFRELLLRATEAVRNRLSALADPESRQRIQSILASISADAQHEAHVMNGAALADAYERIADIHKKGKLSEASFFEFAKANQYPEIVAALSLLSGVELMLIEDLLQSQRQEAYLIPFKVAALDWSTVRAVLSCRSFGRAVSGQALDAVRADYMALSQTSAGRILRFYQVRQSAAKKAN